MCATLPWSATSAAKVCAICDRLILEAVEVALTVSLLATGFLNARAVKLVARRWRKGRIAALAIATVRRINALVGQALRVWGADRRRRRIEHSIGSVVEKSGIGL